MDYWIENLGAEIVNHHHFFREKLVYQKEEEIKNKIYKQSERSSNKIDTNVVNSLNETIEKYENLLNSNDNEEERFAMSDMIKILKKQRNKLENRSETSFITGNSFLNQKKILTLEMKKKFLEEIYHFHCKLTYSIGKNSTFDRVNHECSVMNMVIYIK